jgi:hypothetical protein
MGESRTVEEPSAGGIAWGIGLMLLGLAFMAERAGLLDPGETWRFWPVILIGMGVVRLLAPARDGRRMNGGWLLALSGLFLADTLGWLRFRTTWPVLLVVLGAGMIWRTLTGRDGGARDDARQEEGRS